MCTCFMNKGQQEINSHIKKKKKKNHISKLQRNAFKTITFELCLMWDIHTGKDTELKYDETNLAL